MGTDYGNLTDDVGRRERDALEDAREELASSFEEKASRSFSRLWRRQSRDYRSLCATEPYNRKYHQK